MSERLPKVSINVVAYNQEQFIGECIESLVTQDYPNLEIIVADDASTDKTVEIAKGYQENYPGKIIIVTSDKNQGVHANATKGLKAATGDYFCSFAGDDIMLPGKIRKQVEAMEANPEATMCHTDAYWFDSDSGKILNRHSDLVSFTETSLDEILKKNFICSPTCMIRSTCLPKAYNKEAGSVCDWYIALEVLENGDGIYISEPLIKYRRHAENISGPKHADRIQQDALNALHMGQKNLNIHNKNIYKGYVWILRSRVKTLLHKRDFIGCAKSMFSLFYYKLKFFVG